MPLLATGAVPTTIHPSRQPYLHAVNLDHGFLSPFWWVCPLILRIFHRSEALAVSTPSWCSGHPVTRFHVSPPSRVTFANFRLTAVLSMVTSFMVVSIQQTLEVGSPLNRPTCPCRGEGRSGVRYGPWPTCRWASGHGRRYYINPELDAEH